MRKFIVLTTLFAILIVFLPAGVFAAPRDIRITEIMYDAPGSDTGHEWVEFWNSGSEAVTIVGGSSSGSWRFNDGANHTFFTTPARGSLTLTPGDFLIISSNTDTFLIDHPNFSGNLAKVSFSLGNTSETLLLRIETNGAPWSEVAYTNSFAAGNGKTLEWNPTTNVWQESATPGGTPGSFPITGSAPTPPPEPPPAPSPEPQPASEPSPAPPPEEPAANSSQPTANSDQQTNQQSTDNSQQQAANSPQQNYDLTADLRISEFLPDPTGSDTEEWMEIWNPMSRIADLSGWKIDDGEGGSNPYKFPAGAQIQPGAYEVFSRRLTGLQLNNELDSVRLFRPDGTIKDEVVYGESPEGTSYAKDGIVWKWTASPTPGTKNIFPQAAEKQNATIASEESGADTMENQELGIKNQKSAIEKQEVRIKKQETKSKNQALVFKGIVTVLPGVLGMQIFYAQNEERGLQIYMYKKDFPLLEIGTKIKATGIMGVAYSEDRLKLSAKEDISILGKDEEIQPEEIRIEDLKSEDAGKLVLVKGEAVDVSRGKIIVAHEDGDDELDIIWKAGVPTAVGEIFPGDKVSVTGILKKNKSGFQILPRDEGDLVVEEKTQEEAVAPKRSRRRSWFVYVFGVVSILLSAGIIVQKRNKKLSV